jgi:hypothetical protein
MTVYKVLYLNEGTGEHGRLPDFGIINAGGVIGPTFTVGGKPLLFADGTTTDGSTGITLNVTLQSAYNASTNGTINLTSGKDFTISALNQKIFQVDADTGRVTITGDLTVLGSSTVVEGTLANVDQVVINPPNSGTTGLIIEPMVGVTMGTDLVRIRAQNGGQSVFTIDASGDTYLKQLVVAGTINGIDLLQFYSDFQAHLTAPSIQHRADQVSVDESQLSNVNGSNVQEALESIDTTLGTIASGGATVQAYEHIQNVPSVVWFITHAKNSMRPTVSVYDTDNVQTFADEVKILDANTVRIVFSTPQAGRAIILLF